jgi:hypothetical protein
MTRRQPNIQSIIQPICMMERLSWAAPDALLRARTYSSASRLLKLGLAAGSVAVSVVSSGCASSQHATSSQTSASHTAPSASYTTQHLSPPQSAGLGNSWAVVLPSPGVEPVYEFSASDRLDDTLRPADRDRLATALDQWPRPDRPSLHRTTFVRVTGSRTTGFIFHGNQHRHHSHTRRHWYP